MFTKKQLDAVLTGATTRKVTARKTFRLADGSLKTADLTRTVYDLTDGRSVTVRSHSSYTGHSDMTTFTYTLEAAA